MTEGRRFEWPTLLLLGLCYLGWGLSGTVVTLLWLPLGILGLAVTAALHSSLSHEMLHGHPFRSSRVNAALVFPALTLVVPYLRFKDTHLAHHLDSIITDPYDDPESNYMDPARWRRLGPPLRLLYRANNTLAGRMILGPAIGALSFLREDLRAIRAGDRRILAGWLWHVPALAMVIWWQAAVSVMPVWAFLLGSYLSLSILKIRTFLEHRAHEAPRARTVVVEDRGPLALLFLNNNFHVVHHMHPLRPWYELPRLYELRRAHYLRRNDSYRYGSYAEVFRAHFLKAKDPVPHPLWSGTKK